MGRRSSKRVRRSRGAVLVEYAFLLTVFAIPAMMGIAAGGVQLVRNYQDVKADILKPMP